jgi:hypothetical protein
MAGERSTQVSRRIPPALLFITALLLLIPPVVADEWTVTLNPEEFSTYAACVSSHLGNTAECWLDWVETTVTIPPKTVVSEVLVSVTAALISALSAITASTGSSITSPAMQTSTATVTIQVPVETGSLWATAEINPASRSEAPRTLLFMALLVVLTFTAVQLVGA